MQQIERTRMLSEELQRLVKLSVDEQDWTVADEGDAVLDALKSIFMSRNRLKLDENARPREDIYLQMLECSPTHRADMIAQQSDENLRRKLEIAHGDLIRLTRAEDYHLEGSSELFDFDWVVPLVQQKKSKGGVETGGVKLERLKIRQQLLDLCLRIRPALSLAQANSFLTHVMRTMPLRHRSPVDAVYHFVLISGEQLGDLKAQRAFVIRMLEQMKQHYLQGDNSDLQDQQLLQEKEKQDLELRRLKEEFESANVRDREQCAALQAQMDTGFAAYKSGGYSHPCQTHHAIGKLQNRGEN